MKIRSAFAVLSMTVALAACGNLPFQQQERAAEAPGHSGPPTVSPLEQPIETGAAGRAVATAEASTTATAMFKAAGPGWTATAADKTAVYERPGQKSLGVAVRRMSYARGTEFIGNMNGQVFALNIRAEACETNGGKWPFTATLRVGSQRLTGCAAATDVMPKAQARASSAGPKPKAAAKPAAPAAKPAVPKAAETLPAAAEPAKPAAEPPAVVAPAATPAPEAPAAAPATPAPEAPAPAEAPAAEKPATEKPAEDKPAATGGVPAPALILPVPPAAGN
ncbi:hypothetical protein [Paracoccus sp. (in: a-proteobacteria)]|uniref:hypothetical protein n=1 Tax=Paracoccus sp. TaxID=267 RepID=UPI0032208AD4